MLEQTASAKLVHITCPHCQSAVLALVNTGSFGISAIGMVTDLHAQDAARFRRKTALSDADLFAFHQSIHTAHAFDALMRSDFFSR